MFNMMFGPPPEPCAECGNTMYHDKDCVMQPATFDPRALKEVVPEREMCVKENSFLGPIWSSTTLRGVIEFEQEFWQFLSTPEGRFEAYCAEHARPSAAL